MRRLGAYVVLAAAVACGSSNDNGTAKTSVAVSAGPYAGTYTNAAGLSAAGSCSRLGVTLGGAVLVIGLSSSGANLCQSVTQGIEPANSTTLQLSVLKLNVNGQPQTITPGTYNVVDLSGGVVPTPDAQGNIALANGSATKLGGSPGAGQACTETSSEDVTSGAVTISSVTSTAASGSVNVVLKNGAGTVSGNFSVTLCNGTFALGGSCDNVSGIPSPTSCQ